MCSEAEALQQVLNKLGSYRRKSYIPEISEGEGTIFQSKFGGIPFQKDGEDWPICDSCGKPLQFFLQINVEELPYSLKKAQNLSDGLIQVFICTNDTEECFFSSIEDSKGYTFIRYVSHRELLNPNKNINLPNQNLLFTPKIISSWLERDDYPSLEEMNN